MEAQIERTGGKTMTKLVEEVAQSFRDTKRGGEAAQAAIAKVFDWLKSYNNSNYGSPTVSEFMRVARKEALGEEK